MPANKEVIFVARPKQEITDNLFKFVEKDVPQLTLEGEILVRVLYLSVDPYMRPKMTEEKSYTPVYDLNSPFAGFGIGQVIESKSTNFKEKQIISGLLRWNLVDKYSQNEIRQHFFAVIEPELELSDYLHVVGLTGITAHIGYIKISKPKKGDVVLVSGAAGATGSIVGSIAKLHGASKVIGIVGSADKAELIKKEFGFDEAINYKSENLEKKIEELAPNGVNVYYDNVGGATLDAALANMVQNGKIIACGAISGYDQKQPVYNYYRIIAKRLTVKGFIVFDHLNSYALATKQLTQWVKDGKVKSRKTIYEGFDSLVPALKDLFSGGNIGKAIVHISDPIE